MNASSGDNWVLLLEIFSSSLCFLATVLPVSYVGGRLAFAPLYQRTLLFDVNSRFQISDMILLAAHLQIAVGTILAVAPNTASTMEKTGAVVIAWIVVLFWWVCGIRLMANSGVRYTWHRWLFLGVLMPVGYFCSVLLGAGVFLLPMAFATLAGSNQFDEVVSGVGWIIACGVGSLLLYVCHQACNAISLRARSEQAERDGISFMNQSDA